MKHKLIFILLFICATLISGCESEWQRYSYKEYRFSVLLPSTWKKETGLYKTVLIAKAPIKSPNQRFQENITVVVTQLPQTIDLTTYFEANKDALTKGLSSIAEVSEGTILAGRLEGKWISFEGKMQDLTLKIISAAWMKNNYIYVISCASEAGEFNKYAPIFDRIMRSLRIQK